MQMANPHCRKGSLEWGRGKGAVPCLIHRSPWCRSVLAARAAMMTNRTAGVCCTTQDGGAGKWPSSGWTNPSRATAPTPSRRVPWDATDQRVPFLLLSGAAPLQHAGRGRDAVIAGPVPWRVALRRMLPASWLAENASRLAEDAAHHGRACVCLACAV